MIKTTIQDPKCKYLCPSESIEASSSDEGMPQKLYTLSEADIMAEFPQDMLTPEVKSNISNALEHIEASHTEAAEVMQSMKKLVTTIPVGAFHLLLQVMVQPHIMVQHWWLCHVRSGKEERHCTASLVDMVPDGQLSQNLPNPVRTLAAILHYQLKNVTGIKIAIMATSKLFGTQEKPLHQALKGVHYESGMQKCRWEDTAYDKQEDSSSSEETNDEDDDDDKEGAVTRIKLFKKKHKKWCETTDGKWKHVALKLPHCNSLSVGPLHPLVPFCIPNFQIFLSSLLFHIFQTILSKLKSMLNSKFNENSIFFCKSFQKAALYTTKNQIQNTTKHSFEPKKKHHKSS